MKITNVETQKNNKSRVSVFVDNEYAFSLDETDMIHLGIKTGKIITEEEIEKCRYECDYSKARGKAFDILSVKPVSSKELTDALIKKGYDRDIAENITAELTELGYINDTDFAEIYYEYAISKMWGKKKIEYEMKKRGIDADIIENIFENYDSDERTDEMKDTILLRYKNQDLCDIKVKAKITRYFASRGFDFSQIEKATKMAIKEISDE